MAYKKGGALLNRKGFFLALSAVLIWLVELVGYPIVLALYRFGVSGREKLRKKRQPFIIVSNHSLPLDPLHHALSILPRLTYFTLLEETVLTPVLGTFVRLLGGIPVPRDHERLGDIERAVKVGLEGRGLVHFYPEGECFLLNQEIRPFKAGAFYYAIKFGVPVLPIVTVLKKRGEGGLDPCRLFRSSPRRAKVKAEALILDAVVPPAASGRAAADLHAAIAFSTQVRSAMQAAIDAAGGDKSLYIGPMPRIKGVNDRSR